MSYYLPDWKQSLLLVLIFFAGSVAVAALVTLGGIGSTSLMYALTMMFPLLWAVFCSQRSRASGGGSVPLDDPQRGAFGSMLPVALLCAAATPFIGVLTEPLASLFPMSDAMQAALEKLTDLSHPWDSVLATVILAPLCEELLCRGIICRGLLTAGRPWPAIIFSAFVFALLHGNLTQGTVAFVLGVFMGWVYFRTHCLWCTIAVHFVNNGLSMLFAVLFPDLPVTATYARLLPGGAYIALVIFSAAIVAAVIYTIHRKYKDEQSIVSFAVRPSASRETLGR